MTTAPATADSMHDFPAHTVRDYRFTLGFIAGSVVGAGLGMFFAPRAVTDLRRRAADIAGSLGNAASGRYHEAGTRFGHAVDEITKKGQDLRNDLSDAVVRGAQEVERFAAKAKT